MEQFTHWKTTLNSRWGSRTYEVSDLGRIKINGVLVEPGIINTGYQTIAKKLLHRVVAELFLEPSELPCIDHINGIKTDNRAVNLQWISYSNNNYKAGANSKGGIAAGNSPNSAAIRYVTCPHCNKTGKLMPMKRWHFNNCKHIQHE